MGNFTGLRTQIIRFTLLMVSIFMAVSAAAQDNPPAPIITFEPWEENPILSRTAVEDWGGEDGTIFAPSVIEHEQVFYLFYTGSSNRSAFPAALGYATSTDGFHWDKFAGNPILTPSLGGYDSMCVSMGVPVIWPDGTWALYYAGNALPCAGPGSSIGLATADNPAGPWQRTTAPVLTTGGQGTWDSGFLMPHSIVRTESGYIMYYSGGSEYLLPLPRLIGMATSPDGIVWTKYDNPETTERLFAESDPILELLPDGTTRHFEGWAVSVLPTANGYEMFYAGICPESMVLGCPGFIAYATSEDGYHWTNHRSPDRLVLQPAGPGQEWAEHCVCNPSVLRRPEGYWLYYTGCTEEPNDCQIGLATGTISWSD